MLSTPTPHPFHSRARCRTSPPRNRSVATHSSHWPVPTRSRGPRKEENKMQKLKHRKANHQLVQLVSALAVVLAAAFVGFSQTQITTGTIQGAVTDANGAIVPGANVVIKNLDTNLSRTITTDEGGRFVALALPPGPYSVTVSKQGFATAVAERLDLTVGQALSLPVAMKISQVQETVTITAAPIVDTVKTESSITLNQTTVNQTPILGRKFEDLLTLTPGVSIVQGPDGDEINFAGQRGIFNNVSMD